MSHVVYIAIPAFIALLVIEAVVTTRRQMQAYEARDTAASLTMGIGNVVLELFTKLLVFGLYAWLYERRLFTFDRGMWWAWALAFVADDFCYYWFHRLHHEVRLFWAAHVNHHSSERYNLATALRQSWTTPITKVPFWAPMALVGFSPEMIVGAQALSLLYQFWIHTQLIDRMGPLEWVLNTPSHHRVHHGSNLAYLDRNYGGILIVWDRLFGTFEPEVEPVRYGLTKNIETFNPVTIAFHEWRDMLRDMRRARSPREAALVAMMPPGWSADGQTLTARQERARHDVTGATH